MVYYKDSPDLGKLTTVETVKGDVEYRRNTKFIKQKYYTINRDCFQFNSKWYTIDSGNIVYDHELKTYALRSISQVKGLVLNESGKIEIGYFTPNPHNNVMTVTNQYGKIIALNVEMLEKNKWVEDLGGNYWIDTSELSANQVASRKKIRNERNFNDRGYNIEDNADYPKKINLYNQYPTHISAKAKEMSKYLGDLTFGVEVELRAGNLPDYLKNRLGIVVCRDGSLNGGAELVSIPLAGAKGLQTLANLADELKERGEIGIECSYHIHFGNVGLDKLSIIALYRLARNIQSELFTMFPYYKIDPSGVKQKNYTKKLLKLNINSLKDNSKEAYELYLLDSWKKLFDFYAEGKIALEQFNKKTREHPIQRKWEHRNRYYYMNFLNLFFGHRHTVESRLHSGTINSHKMINWLFINVAIIKYAQKYSKEIITSDKTIPLKEVLDIFPTLFPLDRKAFLVSKYLYQYFLQRQSLCKRDLNKNDFLSMWDIEDDKKYTFEYQEVSGLI